MEAHLVRKHFVQFLYSGALFNEQLTKEVVERDPTKVEVPRGAFAFWFYDRIVGVAVDSGKEIWVSSDTLDHSPQYFYGGKVYTVAELKEKFPGEQRVISNVENNGHQRAIRCRNGNWHIFGVTDILLEEKVV